MNGTDHQYLIQPNNYFSSWDYCAMVFLTLGDEEIKPYLFDLLGWIQDLNWPGAEWILKRLQRESSELLSAPLERAAKLAAEQKDECWLGWMSILIANPNMVNLLGDDTLNLLKPYAAEYWNWDYDKIMEHFHQATDKYVHLMQNPISKDQ